MSYFAITAVRLDGATGEVSHVRLRPIDREPPESGEIFGIREANDVTAIEVVDLITGADKVYVGRQNAEHGRIDINVESPVFIKAGQIEYLATNPTDVLLSLPGF